MVLSSCSVSCSSFRFYPWQSSSLALLETFGRILWEEIVPSVLNTCCFTSFISSSFYLLRRKKRGEIAREPSTVEVSCSNPRRDCVRLVHRLVHLAAWFQQFVSITDSRVQSLLYDHGLGQVSARYDGPRWRECGECSFKHDSSVPDESVERGVLPRVIKTLVDRRRAVKKMIKTEKDPEKLEEVCIPFCCCLLLISSRIDSSVLCRLSYLLLSVGHSPKDNQTDSQFHAWLPWFLELSTLLISGVGGSESASQDLTYDSNTCCTRQLGFWIIFVIIGRTSSYRRLWAPAWGHFRICSWVSFGCRHRGHLWASTASGDILDFWRPVLSQPWILLEVLIRLRGPRDRNAPLSSFHLIESHTSLDQPCLSWRYVWCLFPWILRRILANFVQVMWGNSHSLHNKTYVDGYRTTRATCQGIGGTETDWLGSWDMRLSKSTLESGSCHQSETSSEEW